MACSKVVFQDVKGEGVKVTLRHYPPPGRPGGKGAEATPAQKAAFIFSREVLKAMGEETARLENQQEGTEG